ncbi:prominin-2 [Polypterus senegalus]
MMDWSIPITAVLLFFSCLGDAANSCSSDSLNLMGFNESKYISSPSADNVVLTQMTHSFLALVQPNKFPTDFVISLVNNAQLFIEKSAIEKILKYMVGFLVCVVVGVLYIVLVPVIGCCFSCCRCCDNCGGRMYQKQTERTNCKRKGFYWTLWAITLMILVGNIIMFCSSNSFSKGISTSPELINITASNLNIFLNNIPKEINYLIEESSQPVNKVNSSVNDIGPILIDMMLENLGDSVNAAKDSLIKLNNVSINIGVQLENLSNISMKFRQNQDVLETNLTNIRTQINSTLNNPDCSVCLVEGRNILDKLVPVTVFPVLPSFNDEMNAINEVKKADLPSTLNKSMASVQKELENTTSNLVSGVQHELSTIKGKIQSVSQNIPLTSISNITSEISQIAIKVNNYIPVISKASNYSNTIGIILSCLILLIVLCNIMGLLLGPLTLKSSADPTERTSGANCGGTFFMAGAGLSFLYSWLLMVIVLILFLLGGSAYTLICRPWQNNELLQLIDTPGVIPDFNISQMLGLDTNLEISQIYNDCKNNSALWSVLQLGKKTDLNEILNISKYTAGIKDEFNKTNLNVPKITFLSDNVRASMDNFTTQIGKIDFTPFMEQINKNFTAGELDDAAKSLETLASKVNNQAVKNQLINEAKDLRNLQNWTYSQLMTYKVVLNKTVQQLNTSAASVPAIINATIQNALNAQDILNQNGSSILKAESREFLDCQLGYFQTYLTWVQKTVTQDVARCKPFTNAVDSIETVVCKNVVNSLNAFWYSLGWCLMFLLPSIIVSVKLAKFYRRMKYTDSYEDPSPRIEMTPVMMYTNSMLPVKT